MINYEKVDMNLLNIIQLLNNVQDILVLPNTTYITDAPNFVVALSSFRDKIAAEIERQGNE